MGFWDQAAKLAKNVGTIAIDKIEKTAQEIRETTDKYAQKSDDELASIIRRNHSTKGVAFSVLKKRGYSAEEIKSMLS